MKLKFKKLEIQEERSWFKKILKLQHTKKTIIAIILGAVGGFLYFYFTEGQHQNPIVGGDIVKSALIGGFFGFFVTNSPCARNQC